MAGEGILVIDDNPANLRLLRLLLSAQSYEVRTAEGAAEAINILKQFRPRLILMDLQMPGMNGFELTRWLKGDAATRGIVIVALTAYAMKGDEERVRKAGCDAYVAKPIDTRTLPETVARHLRAPGVKS